MLTARAQIVYHYNDEGVDGLVVDESDEHAALRATLFEHGAALLKLARPKEALEARAGVRVGDGRDGRPMSKEQLKELFDVSKAHCRAAQAHEQLEFGLAVEAPPRGGGRRRAQAHGARARASAAARRSGGARRESTQGAARPRGGRRALRAAGRAAGAPAGGGGGGAESGGGGGAKAGAATSPSAT